jgi:hypothetical protein
MVKKQQHTKEGVEALLCRLGDPQLVVDVSYAAPYVHGIINVALHWEYSLGIVFIFSHGRKYLYHV